MVLENGLRIQVKTCRLIYQNTPMYREGVYAFDLRRNAFDPNTANHQSTIKYRRYDEIADFFVLWGIDEDRFWIISTLIKNKRIYFPRCNSIERTLSPARSYWAQVARRKYEEMESRWDLLDANLVSKQLINSAVSSLEPQRKEN